MFSQEHEILIKSKDYKFPRESAKFSHKIARERKSSGSKKVPEVREQKRECSGSKQEERREC